MSLIPPEPKDSTTVHAHQNEISTGGIMTTAPNRSITTAPTGIKSDIDSRNTLYITVHGPLHQTLQNTENSNSHNITDHHRSSPASPPRRSSLNGADIGSRTFSPSADPRNLLSPCFTNDVESPIMDTYEPLPSPKSTSLEGYGRHFGLLAERIEDGYDAILELLGSKRFRRSRDRKKAFCFDISVQKAAYLENITSLVNALTDLPEASASPENPNIKLCVQINEALNNLWIQLNHLADCIRKYSQRTEDRILNKDRPSTTTEVTKKDLGESLKALEESLDGFANAALQLIEEYSPPDTTSRPSYKGREDVEPNELEKLSIEGRVSAMLYQCLRRACPEQCRSLHIAYLSLEPEKPSDSSSSSDTDLALIRWQCHMAFKSNISKKRSLIWFKVVSADAADLVHPDPVSNAEESRTEGVIDLALPMDSGNGNPKKRRALSTPSKPVPKARKTQAGQSARRVSDPAPPSGPNTPSRLAVCLSSLAQYNLDTLVMNMVDDSGYSHSIFNLPKDKRPKSDTNVGEPVRLSDILGKRQLKHHYDRLCNERLSILRLSRLIAEAVLRFDLQDCDPSPEDSVVFYMCPQNGLAPFLEKVIEKPKQSSIAVEDEDNHSERRTLQLLKLGEILLQLGLPRSQRMRSPPLDPNGRRSFIKSAVPGVRSNMDKKYSDVIISCVNLSALESNREFEEKFQERYYESIVQPLRDLERGLLSFRQVTTEAGK